MKDKCIYETGGQCSVGGEKKNKENKRKRLLTEKNEVEKYRDGAGDGRTKQNKELTEREKGMIDGEEK